MDTIKDMVIKRKFNIKTKKYDYYNSRTKKYIVDKDNISHFNSLRIPPAYTNVKISLNNKSKIWIDLSYVLLLIILK